MKKILISFIILTVSMFLFSSIVFAAGKAEVVTEEWMPSVGTIADEDYKAEFRKAKERYLIAFANQTRAIPYCIYVEEGYKYYAEKFGVDLIVLDNDYDEVKAVENARIVINRKVDFFADYQCRTETNTVIGDMLKEAGIPGIASDCPIKNYPYFGGNNTVSGGLGGKWLGEYATKHWRGEHVVFIYIDVTAAGHVAELRKDGYIDGVKGAFPAIKDEDIYHLDTNNNVEDALEKTRAWLSAHPDEHHILIGVIHDGLAVGALQAIRAMNREKEVIMISQGCDETVFAEIRDEKSCFKGSVAFFPENYAFFHLAYAIDYLEGRPVPENLYIPHVTVTAENIDQYYPGTEQKSGYIVK